MLLENHDIPYSIDLATFDVSKNKIIVAEFLDHLPFRVKRQYIIKSEPFLYSIACFL